MIATSATCPFNERLCTMGCHAWIPDEDGVSKDGYCNILAHLSHLEYIEQSMETLDATLSRLLCLMAVWINKSESPLTTGELDYINDGIFSYMEGDD